MRRRLFTILSALSLVLCLATVALWVRSYFVQDCLFINAGKPPASGGFNRTAYQLYSVKGNNVLHIQTTAYTGRLADSARRAIALRPSKAVAWLPTTRPGYSFNYNPDVRHNPLIYRLGFRFSHSMDDRSPSFPGFTEARLPHWLFALLFALLPSVFLIRARRKPRNCCQSCGYDLRATPDRCPECGTVAKISN